MSSPSLNVNASVFVPSFVVEPSNRNNDEPSKQHQMTKPPRDGGGARNSRGANHRRGNTRTTTRQTRKNQQSSSSPSTASNHSTQRQQQSTQQRGVRRGNKKSRNKKNQGGGGGNSKKKGGGSRNHHGDIVKTSEQLEVVEETFVHEALFPPLLATPLAPIPPTTVMASSSSNGWSRIAKEGHVAEDRRLEQEAREQNERERNMKLTFLSSAARPAITEQASAATSAATVVEASNTIIERMALEPAQPQQPSTKRQLDMSKMRDRWWVAVKEKRVRDAEEVLRQHCEAQCEETASEADDDDESSSAYTSIDDESEIEEVVSCFDDSIPFALHRAVIDNDDQAVRRLLSMSDRNDAQLFMPASRRQLGLAVSSKLQSADSFTPLHVAVYLDRLHLLRILLGDVALVKAAETATTTPLMLAAELSVEGCLKQILSRGGSAVLTTKDTDRGETAVHMACRAGVPSSTLKLLLTWSGGGGNKMQKPLFLQNTRGQTPLHVACEARHSHLVETFLSICSTSMLSRLLCIQDDQHQTPLLTAVASEATEVVMALLMYKGHQGVFRSGSKKHHAGSDISGPCPLAWAVSLGSMEMMHTLLEFSDSDGYNLNSALQAAIRGCSSSSSCENTNNRVDICRVLVEAGANPCISDNRNVECPVTALSIAAIKGDSEVLGLLIDAYQHQLKERQMLRRQDAQLQKQPESYFRTIESAEKYELDSTLNDALVRALFLGWRESTLHRLQAATLLFKKGSRLRDAGFARLKRSIVERKLKTMEEVVVTNESFVYETDYIHYGPDNDELFKVGAYNDKSALSFWTRALLRLPWMREQKAIQCAWILAERDLQDKDPSSAPILEDTVTLNAQGTSFVVHTWIVSQKCAKLAAAIRFASINQDHDESGIEINVSMSPQQCKWFLQHVYSGSILSDLGPNACQELFELALVAQEFLCPSLLQECEMRLLSSSTSQCFCWSCCLAVRKVGKNECQCLYRVQTPSSSLGANSAIDGLALSQQLATFDAEEYRIKFWAKPKYPSSSDVSYTYAWNHYDSNSLLLTKPFLAAKEAALKAILLDYANVLKSESFRNQLMNMMDDDDEDHRPIVSQDLEGQVMLLELCLEELARSEMTRVEHMAAGTTPPRATGRSL